MRQNSILVALSALAAVACAQQTQTGNYTVDPSTVDTSDKGMFENFRPSDHLAAFPRASVTDT